VTFGVGCVRCRKKAAVLLGAVTTRGGDAPPPPLEGGAGRGEGRGTREVGVGAAKPPREGRPRSSKACHVKAAYTTTHAGLERTTLRHGVLQRGVD
jgi:hypothetical protein